MRSRLTRRQCQRLEQKFDLLMQLDPAYAEVMALLIERMVDSAEDQCRHPSETVAEAQGALIEICEAMRQSAPARLFAAIDQLLTRLRSLPEKPT